MDPRSLRSLRASRAPLAALAAALILASAGCSDATATRARTGTDTGDTSPADTGDDARRPPDTSVDTRPGPELNVGRGYGEICAAAADCEQLYCLVLVPGQPGICSQGCQENADCPEGSDCVLITSTGGDAERVCVPRNLCVDADEDGYGVGPGCRGPDCNDDDDLINPAADETCNAVDDDCDGTIDNNTLETRGTCNTGLLGVCGVGTPVCNQGELACSVSTEAGPEKCNGLDDDCDGEVDENATNAPTWYPDADNDRFGDPAGAIVSCSRPASFVEDGGDCNDSRRDVSPAALERCDGFDNDCNDEIDEDSAVDAVTWFLDLDGDGYGDPATEARSCNPPENSVSRSGDCNDQDNTIREGARELCDGIDNDCDGEIDETDLGVTPVWFRDADGDGFGDPDESLAACASPGDGWVDNDRDCDDTDDTIHPDADELCDFLDNDCDGDTDENDAIDALVWYRDADNDEWGDPRTSTTACARPDGWVADSGDCNDTLDAVNPDATEICNGFDDDCDGDADESDAEGTRAWYLDNDNDGFGRESAMLLACNRPDLYAGVAGDCDDDNFNVNPSASELCNDIDDDCNGEIDDGNAGGLRFWYLDFDSDQYGDRGTFVRACSRPVGYVDNDADCDDRDNSVNPGAAEACDGIDNDCDTLVDEPDAIDAGTWYVDGDNDSFGDLNQPRRACFRPVGAVANSADCNDANPNVNPNGIEICNGVDDNCDNAIDNNATNARTWFRDADSDTFGTTANSRVACTQPNGFVADAGDCNDADPNVFPGALEVCNLIDDDCDNDIDEGSASFFPLWYRDADNDQYGDPLNTLRACARPAGYVAQAGDCDDGRNGVNPAALESCATAWDDNCNNLVNENTAFDVTTWFRDADNDTFGTPDQSVRACTQPTGFVANSTDCNDNNGAIKPGAVELCNNIDDNCDTLIDNDAPAAPTWYRDADGDVFGNASNTRKQCTQPAGYVNQAGDCNDDSFAIKPGATELCNGVDDNCNNQIDEGVRSTFWADGDTDGFGDPARPTEACSRPTAHVTNDRDCNDSRNDINPNATEVCDSVDNDCDGFIDENVTITVYRDFDNDTWGDPLVSRQACAAGSGWVANNSDCNDNAFAIKPGATEICNGVDDNCNNQTDEGVRNTYYRDADSDTYGNPGNTTLACTPPAGYVTNNTDCNDGNAAINPGATEICNGFDDNCDNQIDIGAGTTWYQDSDNDTWGTDSSTIVACNKPTGSWVNRGGDCNDNNSAQHPNRPELCSTNFDDDCDGSINEDSASDAIVYYMDSDSDGFGLYTPIVIFPAATRTCPGPTKIRRCFLFICNDYVPNDDDCDDSSNKAKPNNPVTSETVDGYDNDCDGTRDGTGGTYLCNEGAGTRYYRYDSSDDDCDDIRACAAPTSSWTTTSCY